MNITQSSSLENQRPNILWIMTDQQRLDALGCTGGWIHSPNIDTLVAEGALFTGMFAQSPVCVPSRVNFITGRYPHSHRVRQNHTMVGKNEPHLFRVLKSAGYKTGVAGKNHMFSREDLARLDFDRTDANEHDPHGNPEYNAHLEQIRKRMEEVGSWAGACWHTFPEEYTRTARTGRAACDFLRESISSDPFFLWVSFEDPHAEHTAPLRFQELYPEEAMEIPENSLGAKAENELKGKPRRQAIKRQAQLMPAACENDIKKYKSVYGGMVSFVDEQIGLILEELRNSGQEENTIVIFTSDHGDFLGEHGMVKKDLLMYDCQLRIPFVIRYPGLIKSGQIFDSLCEQIDIYPTLLDCLGLASPCGIQGRSFYKLFTAETVTHREEIHAEICPPSYRNPYSDFDEFISQWRAAQETNSEHPLRHTSPFNVPGDFIKCLRTRQWKYIWYANGEEELYALEKDPQEKVNLSGDPAMDSIKTSLKIHLLEWNALSEDTLDPSIEAKL